MIYSELIERAVNGAKARRPQLDLDVLRVQADAAFPQINSNVAEEFASVRERRRLLRATVSITFTAGNADAPANLLKKFMEDATLIVGTSRMAYRTEYEDYRRWTDKRLGAWVLNGETITAKMPNAAQSAVTGAQSLVALFSPDIPATEDAEYTGPDDMVPELIDALIESLLSSPLNLAAKIATQ